jgi:hypothetical protein
MFRICCFRFHTTIPNSSRLTNNPITLSWSRIDWETPLVLRMSRFRLVRKVRCFAPSFASVFFPPYVVRAPDHDGTPLHHQCRNDACRTGRARRLTGRRHRPAVVPTRRLRRLPSDGQWPARALGVGMSSQEHATVHRRLRLLLGGSQRSPLLDRCVDVLRN